VKFITTLLLICGALSFAFGYYLDGAALFITALVILISFFVFKKVYTHLQNNQFADGQNNDPAIKLHTED